MATPASANESSDSVPSSGMKGIQLNPIQSGPQTAVEDQADICNALPLQQRELSDDWLEERIKYHMQAIDEIEQKFASDNAAEEEIIISSNLRQSLPHAVENLLNRLETSSSVDPLRSLKLKDLQGPGFGDLFWKFDKRSRYWDKRKGHLFDNQFRNMPKEWAAEVRLMVFTAVAQCKTLETLDLRGPTDELQLTLQELKVLLLALQSSTVLRELDLSNEGIMGKMKSCKVVAGFLKANCSLRVLRLDINRGYTNSYIQHYLSAYGHPTLENLDIALEANEDVVTIIQACPKLKHMPSSLNVKDERMARICIRVLSVHEPLVGIDLQGDPGPVSMLLRCAFIGAPGAASLKHLRIEGNDGRMPRGSLAPVMLANRTLEVVRFFYVSMPSEEWQGVFRSLRQNACLKDLVIYRVTFDAEEGSDSRAWEEMLALVEECPSLQSLSLVRAFRAEYKHYLSRLFEAVRSNKSLNAFNLWNFDLSSDEMACLATLIQETKALTKLELYSSRRINWKEFFLALQLNTSVQTFRANARLDDVALQQILVAIQVNSSLRECNLSLQSWREDVIQQALKVKAKGKAVNYALVSTCDKDLQQDVLSLRKNGQLKHLFLSLPDSEDKNVLNGSAWEALEALVKESSTLKSLTVVGPGGKANGNLCKLFSALSCSKSLRSLRLLQLDISLEETTALAGVIQSNIPLNTLIYDGVEGAHWEELFRVLRYNTQLEILELHNIRTLDDGAFKELLASLQVNSSLAKIFVHEINWEEEGKVAILHKALEQKGRRESYLAAMKEKLGEEFQVPDTGRLFLCGSPYAGKTQLREALTKYRANSWKNFQGARRLLGKLSRTEGIEIEHLRTEFMEISIWDLAGHDIFRALQDFLFPKLNLACVFLYVFSPYNRSNKSLKSALSEELHREFLPWLRFIASNSSLAHLVLPQVKVFVSHKHKLKYPGLGWVEDVVHGLRLQFEGVLDIDKKVFCADSKRGGEDVKILLDHVLKSFHDLNNKKLFSIPRTCLTIGKTLTRSNIHRNTKLRRPMSMAKIHEPILQTSDFFEFCKAKADSLKDVDCSNTENLKLMRGVTEYLHDAGSIIQFCKSDLVVSDPNWFTFSFLGRLIGAGHDFQDPVVNMQRSTARKDGLVSASDFQALLHEFAEKLKNEGYSRLEVGSLQKLMEEMDLCVFVDANHFKAVSGIFAPAIFADEGRGNSAEGLRQLPNWRCVAEESNLMCKIIYVGLRVQCRDQTRKTLTPSFFPKFQIHFRNYLMSSQGLRQDQIACDYNMIYILFQNYEIYVESDGNHGDHLDILVRSPRSRTETLSFIHHLVVKQVQDFCASPKGCPGVELVTGVLRTDCVANLTLSAYRDEQQAILIQDLKGKWKEYILSLDDDNERIWEEETVADYHYMWPISAHAKLKEKSERVKDLLTEKDYVEVLKSVNTTADTLKKRRDQVKTTEEEIINWCTEFGDRARGLCAETSTSERSNSSAPLLIVENPVLHKAVSDQMVGLDRMLYEFGKLGEKVDRVGENVDNMREELKSTLKVIHQDVKLVKSYQRETLERLVSINDKFDQVIASFTTLEMPKRPYLTRDLKWTHRISAAVYIGRSLRLHFMCEERSGNHFVGGQPGYPFIVKEEDAEVIRFIMVNSVKIFWYLLKAGVQVAAGLGNVIPEIENGGGGITMLSVAAVGSVLDSLGDPRNSNLIDSHHKFDRSSVEQGAWKRVSQLFAESLKGKSAKFFLLYRARYRTAQSEVWLCKDCFDKGIQSCSLV